MKLRVPLHIYASGVLFLILLGFTVAGIWNGRATAQHKRLVQRLHEEVWTRGNLAAVDEPIAEDFVGHLPGGPWRGAGEFKQRVLRVRSAFPDWSETEEDAFAAGDKVVSRWTSRGTHLGDFME